MSDRSRWKFATGDFDCWVTLPFLLEILSTGCFAAAIILRLVLISFAATVSGLPARNLGITSLALGLTNLVMLLAMSNFTLRFFGWKSSTTCFVLFGCASC